MGKITFIKICFVSLAILFGVAIFAFAEGAEDNLPTAADINIVSGAATIDRTANSLTVTATSPKTIIESPNFDVATNESFYANMPSADSAMLWRAVGGNVSDIAGYMDISSGMFVLVNEAGIHVHSSATINASNLILSTRGIDNVDFLNGNYAFKRLSKEQVERLLLIEGNINIRPGGISAFIAGAIENRGNIIAPVGRIVLATGDAVTVDISGDGMINVVIDEPVARTVLDFKGDPITDQIKNTGNIEADGGIVILKAESALDIFDLAINLKGRIKADRVEANEGEILIVADGDVKMDAELVAPVIKIGDLEESIPDSFMMEEGVIEAEKLEIIIDENMILNKVTADDILLKAGGFILDSANPEAIISGGQVNLNAKKFGRTENPLNINAVDLKINRTTGDIDILQSLLVGGSIMVRGPPEGWGKIIYSKSANLTLNAQKVTLAGPDSVHLFGNITFNNLEITTPGTKIYFEKDKKYIFRGNTYIRGRKGYDNLIKLLSSEEGALWYSEFSGAQDISYVAIQDSCNTGDLVKAKPSTNWGNSWGWDMDPTWDGGGSTLLWSDAANWSTGSAPTASDIVDFDGTSVKDSAVDAGFNGTDTIGEFNISSGYTGIITLLTNLTVSTNGGATSGDFTMNSAPAIFNETVAYAGGSANNLTVATTSTLTAGTFRGPNNPNGATTPAVRIATAADLRAIETDGRLSENFVQSASFDVDATIANFTPIGTFTGSYNGNGYNIQDLVINRSGTDNVGLFGDVNGSANGGIANVNITGTSTISGRNKVGALVGYSTGNFQIRDCTTNANVTGTGSQTGGFIGQSSYNIQNCSVTGNVTNNTDSRSDVGGFAGYNGSTATLSNCTASGLITVGGSNNSNYGRVGGLVGINYGTINDGCAYTGGTIKAYYTYYVGGLVARNFGTISYANPYTILVDINKPVDPQNPETVSGYGVGGLVGVSESGSRISGAFTVGDNATDRIIRGCGQVGGLVGKADSLNGTYPIDGCTVEAKVTVEGRGGGYIGGLVGHINGANTKLKNSTFKGIVVNTSTGSSVGGLVGEVDTGTIENCDYSGSSSRTIDAGGAGYVGGLVGYMDSGTIITSSTPYQVDCDVTTTGDRVGGFAGKIDSDVTVTGTFRATGAVTGGSYVGGLIGRNYVSLDGFSSTGNVTSNGNNKYFVGGLIGHNTSPATLANCTASGTVTVNGTNGYNYGKVGGLAGYNSGTITDGCAYTGGTIRAYYSYYVGGLVGMNAGTINFTNPYTLLVDVNKPVDPQNPETVSGYETGGLVGASESGSRITGAFTIGDNVTDRIIRGCGYVGGLAGEADSLNGTYPITGCTVEAKVTVEGRGGGYIGGLVGHINGANTKLQSSTFKGTVTNTGAGSSVGGLVGEVDSGTIQNCDYSGSSSRTIDAGGAGYVGGLVGRMDSGTITTVSTPYQVDCDVTTTGSYVGGFAGQIDSDVTVTGTFRATGNVTGGSYVGGLIGSNYVNLDGFSATGNVTSDGDSKYYVGGFIGYNNSGTTLENCTASGTVTVNGYNNQNYGQVGGLAGYNGGTITDGCAYTGGTISALQSYFVGGLVGRNYGTISYTNPYQIVVDISKTGTIGGTYEVGGLVGAMESGSKLVGAFTVGDGTAKTIRGRGSVGGLVGTTNQVSAADPIDGCIVEANVSVKGVGGSSIGGLIGKNTGANTKIKDCVFKGTVTNTGAGGYVGGLVGFNEASTIENCDYSGSSGKTVAGDSATYVGGLVGRMYSSGTITVTGSPYVIACDVTSTGDYVGGFAGRIESGITVTGTVRATGDVTGGGAVGGLVGYNDVSLDGFSATGNVISNGDSKSNIGGLVGYNATGKTLTNCTASGTVTVNGSNNSSYGRVGGLVGENYGTITDGCAYTGGTVDALKSYFVGGLVGRNYGTISYTNPHTIVVDINAAGTSTAYEVGGLVGAMESGSKLVGAFTVGDGTAKTIRGRGSVGGLVGTTNQVSAADPIDGCIVETNVAVKGEAGSFIGGLVGYNSGANTKIKDCVFKGTVTNTGGGNYVGGLVGYSETATIENCDYSGSAGKTVAGGGAGYVGGLVGRMYSGTITVTGSPYVVACDVTSSGSYVGGFAGRIGSSATVTGTVRATGDVTGGGAVGGLVGYNQVSLDGYSAAGNVTSNGDSKGDIGGLVGYNASGKTLANCTASGTVTVNGSNGSSYGRIGGLVGTNYGTITDGCAYTGGTITALKSYYAGGFVGRNYGTINYTNPYTITVDINKTGTLVGAYYVGGLVGECLNSASSIRGAFTVGDGSAITIRGTGYTGGFVGAANSISATYPIDGCTVSANVSVKSDAGSYTGGFVGYNQSSNSTIQNCTTTATVEHLNGASYVGGFVGYNSSAKIIDCDYNGTATIDAGSAYYVGGFAGSSSGTITFSSRYTAQSDVTTTGDYVGGFAGRVSGTLTGTVTATGDVTGRNFVGGSIGENLVNLDSYYAEGRVIGADYVGGLLGYNNGKTVENCYASGNVGAGGTTDDYVGGLVGYSAGSSANINKCYATGTVTGDYYIGGLVGYSTATMPINDCYATGAPTGNYYVGGLVGYNASSGTVNRCYAAGDVTGNNTYGGLVGYDNNNTTSDYSANFWDISVQTGGVTVGVGNRTGASWDAVVTSKTTAQLRQEATFSPAAGWDFTNTWNIIEDVRYPFLRWRYPSTVAGIAYTDMEGTTPLTSVGLKLVKNGTLQTVDATTDATTGKYYFMLDTALAADDLILTYINDNATNGNTVTIVAADPEISGLDIYGSTVIARNEAAGTITNANFATGYYSDPGGDTLFGLDGSNNMDVNGSLIVWDAPSTDFQPGANLRVQDSFINNGTFTHGNKQVVFDGTSGGNEITSNSSAFYDVLVDGAGGGWVLQDAIVIGRNFQINNGTIDGNSKVITIGGNFTDNSSTLTNPGLVTFDGAGTWTVTSGNTNFGDVTFNNAGGTWTLQDDLTVGGTLSLDAGTLDPDDNDVYVGGGWDNNGGDFDHNDGGGVYFNGSGPQTIDPNGGDFNDLTFQGSGTYVFQDDLDVGGDCALSGGTLGQAVDIDITGSYAQSGGSLTCSDPVTYSFDVGDSFSRTGGTFNRYTGLGTTAADPYMVRDVFDLQAMDQDMYKHYKLAGNIDATPTQNWNDNGAGGFYGFAPVGSYFYRTLEGNNKTITGLYINRPGEDFVGLFQRTNGSQAIIQNVELVNPDITGRDYVGPLVGYHYNGPDIINCSVTGASGSVTGDDYVGGLVGENYGSGSRIENSDSTADVTGGATVGGLVGSNRTSAVVSECHATGTVTSTKDYSYVGGLIGSNAYSGTVEDSYATGAVSATGTGSYSYIGGLVGTVYRASVTDSYATGTATQSGTFTYSYAGGLVGQNRDGAVVEWCRAEGAVNAGTNGTAHAGGFVGLNEDDASVTDSYATGTASAGHYAGGFVGFHQETASISRCYATGVVTGTGPTGNGFGGFAGYTSSSVGITNCYATGGVTNNGSNNRVGGFAGYSQGSPLTNNYSTGRATYNGGANTGGGFLGWRTSNVFTDNYWDTDTSGINTGCGGITVPGVTGKTTAQMKQRATFASWDFDTVWMIDDGVSYPQFQWQHHVWTGDGATNNWSEGANWNLGTQPGAANWAFFKDDDKDATIDAGFAGTVKGLNISSEYSGTVTQSTNTMVSKTYSQYSGTFTCGTTLDVNGDLILGGGTLDPDGNDINVGGSWVNTGGTFNHNDSGEVIFDGTDQDVTSNGESFNDVDLDSSGTCTLQDDLEVAGTLTLSGGTLDPDGYDINVGGDWENQGGNFDHNDSGEVIFDGTDQEIRSNGESFNDVDIDTSDLTCTLQDDLEVNGTLTLSGGTLDPNGYDISVEGDWDNQGGSFDHNDSGEVVFDGSGDQDVTSNGESFNDVDFDSSGTCTLQDDLEVAGTLTLSGGTLDPDGNDVFLSGDWDNQGGSFDHNDSGEVIFDGDSQDVTSNGESFNDVDFDTSDQTATLQDDFEANNVTISGGTLDANGQGITVNGDWDNQGTFTHNRSTVTFSGNGGDITSGGSAFRHVVFNSSGNTWMLQDNFTARNVTISNGTLDGNGSNITVKGNWLNQDTFTHNNSTVRFRGAGGDITSGGSGFRHVFFNSSEQTWVLQDTFNAKNVTISQGTLDANGQNMKVTGDWLNQDIFTHNGNVVRFRGNSSSITSGGSSFNNVFFNKTGSTWTFQDAFDADGNFTITDGTVAAGAFQVNVGGDFADNSTTLTTSGLVIFDGSGNFTITSGSTMFNNLTFNNAGGTWTLQDALDVNGNLLIDNGTLACGANNINAAGNWTNNGTFNAGTGEVIFDGAGTSVLTGDTTFNDLTRNAAGGQLTVWEGSTQTVTGTLTLQGQVGNELKLRSSNDGAQWMIDPQGATRNVQDVDVQDSNNINGTAIDATNDCTDSGNNTNWDFGGGGGGGETPTEEQADEATKGTDQLSNQEEATGKWLASLAGLNEDYRAQLIIALIEFLEIADEMGLEHGFDIDFLRQQLGLPSPEEEPDE